ncbi:methyltransferase [Gilliamella sp. B2840]|uniref:tRNA1(Val) (adenine(37)-N6)-methyltransferase n=1 Tax=unclassified Gilliamella TaxID=2685620 RepID=UPI002269A3C0|nr:MULTISPECIES: methyltransferase [unclassified Gilliamella]MCX8656508.1 methyltransferase [Gilliamella sp. B2894]MCX8664981.1 methyltransferase [Gilliamella sp. B2887]MCX8692937.1 methyltransferase [Gilliamella sp. B2881]MCX8696278.1 methyltransferase [Gilliamella sp. B2828]MCX8697577.1 methyltransferase [Gilliamella sp. B3000]
MINSHQEPLKKGGFTFKRFFVAHDKSPMQVTTDSCLLGAWAPIDHHPQKILDIGTGCGVIALMLAQRLAHYPCQIDAIDIDADAVRQCQENSVHADLLSVKAQQADINAFRPNISPWYDLIVTNPPYFEPAVDCRNSQRQQARYTESLNFEQLIHSVKRLLKPTGLFCLVLPFDIAHQFTCLCETHQLFLQQELQVKYNENKNFSLSLLAFSLTKNGHVFSKQLCMRDDDGRYSSAFRQLLVDFYLLRK